MSLPPLVREWAQLAGPAAVLAEVRRRIEAGTFTPGCRLGVGLDAPARSQVGRLLGVRWEVRGGALTARGLEEALAPYGVTVRDVLLQTTGPLRDRPAERRRAALDRAADLQRARAILAGLLGEVGPERLDVAVARCLPRPGAGRAAARAEALARAWAHLPSSDAPQLGLAVLAARATGDAHALDRDRPLGRAMAWLAAVSAGGYAPALAPADPLSSAAAWREAWAGRGVSCDDVSSTVLVLNLPLAGPAPAAALTGVPGEPVWLTARMLRGPLAPGPGVRRVFVCENPSVIEAAADRWGPRCAPLVCLYGVPSRAAILLLDALAAHDVPLHVRADGDAAGEGIVERLRRRYPAARPWRPAPGRYEEEVLEDLLTDLESG